MISKISRGGRAVGLMAYLADTRSGKTANVHTSPHLVAASDGLMEWFDSGELSKADAMEIGRVLERPSELHQDVKVRSWAKKSDGSKHLTDSHVWHCSLSLKAEEGQLGSEAWGRIAKAFVEGDQALGIDGMGFELNGAEGIRWTAVHHGQNRNGGDHIHIALNLVAENGKRAYLENDYFRARNACRQIQKAFGLDVIEGEETAAEAAHDRTGPIRSARGETREELEAAGRDGTDWNETYTEQVARRVRCAADASVSEADFVRRLRHDDLWVSPFFAKGRDDVVTGYSVRARLSPGHPDRVGDGWGLSRAGGKLSRDLSLPQLRARWESTPESALEAAAEWRRAKRGLSPTAEPVATQSNLMGAQRVAWRMRKTNEQLAKLSPTDPRWIQIAGEMAGISGQLAARLEPNGGPFTDAARHWNKCASWSGRGNPAKGSRKPRFGGAALTVSSIALTPSDSMTAYALIAVQMMRTAQAMADAYEAGGRAKTAARTREVAVERLGRALAASGAPTDEQLRELLEEGKPLASGRAFAGGDAGTAGTAKPSKGTGRAPLPGRISDPRPTEQGRTKGRDGPSR